MSSSRYCHPYTTFIGAKVKNIIANNWYELYNLSNMLLVEDPSQI